MNPFKVFNIAAGLISSSIVYILFIMYGSVIFDYTIVVFSLGIVCALTFVYSIWRLLFEDE